MTDSADTEDYKEDEYSQMLAKYEDYLNRGNFNTREERLFQIYLTVLRCINPQTLADVRLVVGDTLLYMDVFENQILKNNVED